MVEKKRVVQGSAAWPDQHASIWSLLTFGWVWPIIELGKSRPLEHTDLWTPWPSHTAGVRQRAFQAAWREERQRVGDGATVSFGRVLFRCLGLRFVSTSVALPAAVSPSTLC